MAKVELTTRMMDCMLQAGHYSLWNRAVIKPALAPRSVRFSAPAQIQRCHTRKTLLALSVLAGLAGLAGGTAATPADAAPLAHGLLPSVEALLPVANTATDAALNEGASVQTVQYYRCHYSRY